MIGDFEYTIWMNLAGVVLYSFIAIVAWRHREKPAGVPLVVFSVAGVGWAIVPDLAFAVLGWDWVYWGTVLGYVWIDLLVVAWFYIAVEYSSRELSWVPSMVPVLIGVPLLDQLVQWTNPLHGLFYARMAVVEPGPLFYGHAVGATITIATGIVLVVDEYRHSRGAYRRQAAAIAWAMGSFLLTTIAYLIGLAPGGSSAFSIVGPIVGVVFLWALFYADFLEVAPVARQTLVDSMSDGVVAFDTQGRIIELNRAARSILDVDTDVVGRPSDAVFTTVPTLTDHVGTGVETTTTVTVDREGETNHYDLRVSPVYDDAKGVFAQLVGIEEEYVGDVVAIRDVTEGRRKELALERTNRRLDQFVRFVGHDLRSPLGIASTYLDFAQETGNDEDFEAVRNRLDRMGAILDDLLGLARMHEKSIHREPCQLAAISQSAWEHLDTTGASLTVEDELTLSADSTYLHTVFENLFRNAIEHGGSEVTIHVGALEDGSGFYVDDDGRGIPEGMESEILEQGYSTKSDGTGLGLSIVQTIVDAHGWALEVTDSESGGARFELRTTSPSGE